MQATLRSKQDGGLANRLNRSDLAGMVVCAQADASLDA